MFSVRSVVELWKSPQNHPLPCVTYYERVVYYGKISSPAPVAQWIERRPPEPKAAVRVCPGALPQKVSSKQNPPHPRRIFRAIKGMHYVSGAESERVALLFTPNRLHSVRGVFFLWVRAEGQLPSLATGESDDKFIEQPNDNAEESQP